MIEIMKLEAAYLIFKNSNCVKYLVFIFLVFNASHVYAAKSVNDIMKEYYPILSIMRLSSAKVLLLIMALKLMKAST